MERDNVTVIGSGMMGSGIAAICALANESVVLVDTNIDQARNGRLKALEAIREREENGLSDSCCAERARRLISVCDNLESGLAGTKLVIEAIYENLPAKQALFKKMDQVLPINVPIASNTSGLRITDISAMMEHPERALTTHFWFPAHLVPLVEVVMSDFTREDIAVAVRDLLNTWGKTPVLVRRDLPGQLANRILQAVIREAVNIVEMGLASPEDVDTAVKMGMGIRFPAWGPLEHIDAVGLDLALSVQDTVLPGLADGHCAANYLKELVEKGNKGYKSGNGLYDWSQKDMDALARGRNEFIIHALKKIDCNNGVISNE